MESKGRLYLVPTPIGHLADMTFRAVEVLKSVDTILCEDTRTSGILLKHYSISKPLKAFHLANEHKALASVMAQLQEGRQLALISDAGTPGISDPGFLLVRACVQSSISVECLPGATALIPALVVSGFPSDRFIFEGFLPPKKGRETRIKALLEEERTVILYESPHKIAKTLEQLLSLGGGERMACLCRELSKKFEEVRRGTIAELLQQAITLPPKGEMVLLIHGK
jgi:16S rRNA (cytidine1402-2'-O)-methyltransferase